MSRRLILPALLALGLGACATIPQELTGTYTTITPENATAVAPGTRVRWGGDIIQTEPQERATCFFVLGEPLDVYAKGREITVTGTVSGSETRKVGDYDYAYPRVDADVVYLWPKRPMYAPSPYYDPFYGPFYDPFFGPFGPGFFPPPVIIVQPRTPPPPPPSKPSHH